MPEVAGFSSAGCAGVGVSVTPGAVGCSSTGFVGAGAGFSVVPEVAGFSSAGCAGVGVSVVPST